MELKTGDWVRTKVGSTGKVIHISRLTVFVAFDVAGNERVEAFLESQLMKVDRVEQAV